MQSVIYFPFAENTIETTEESVAKVVIGPAEWEKINSAINKAIETAIASLRPESPWHRIMDFLRRWGAIAVLWTVPLGLLTLAAGAVYVAVARVDKQARFEEKTTEALTGISEHLKNIDAALSGLQLQQAAANPTDKNSAAEAKRAIDAARATSAKIPSGVIEQAGRKFVNASSQNPPAWDTALTLVNYRSFLSADVQPPLGQTSTPPSNSNYKVSLNLDTPQGTSIQGFLLPKEDKRQTLGVFNAGGPASPEDSARLEDLRTPQTSSTGTKFFLVDGGDHQLRIVLDGDYMKNVVIRNAIVLYRGGPVRLQNVFFINCKFEMKTDRNSQNLVLAVLAADPSTTFSGE